MRLLIVVDKLLTGFDAPPATYLYIDKKMRDHGLFQAICRVNRLDGDDKDYGYIVDYRDLFNSLRERHHRLHRRRPRRLREEGHRGPAVGPDGEGARGSRRGTGDRSARSASPSPRRKNTLQYQQYFCAAEQGNAEQLKANEPKRVDLYKAVAAVTRCYGNLANEMSAAGYTDAEAAAIKTEIAHYAAVRDEVKLGAGEDIDFKQYEAGMRFLLDTYIQADASETVADFEDTGLIQLIVQMGAGAIDKLPKGIKTDPEAVAETIANNMRKVIIDERAMNPKYYDKMSAAARCPDRAATQGAHRLQGVPGEADRPGPAARQARVRHRLPRLGRQRRQAALIDFGLPDEIRPSRSTGRSCTPSRTTGSATR